MKKKGYVIGGFLLILFVALFFIIGGVTHSKTNFYKKLENALNEKNATKLQPLLLAKESTLKIDKQGTKAFITYMNHNQADKKQFLEQVKKSSENEQNEDADYQITEKGKSFLFFPKYVLTVKPMYFTVTTDAKQVSLTTFGETISYNKKKDLYGPLMPGTYNIKASVSDTIDVPIVSLNEQSIYHENKNLNLNVDDIMSKDKKFQKEISQLADQSMIEYQQFWGTGMDRNKLVHFTDSYKGSDSESIKEYISKIRILYKGIQVNKDSLEIDKKLDDWILTLDADIQMDGQMDTIVEGYSPKLQFNGVCKITFKYDQQKKSWLINGIENSFSDAGDWDNIEKIEHKNAKALEWTNKKSAESEL
ncbi:TcaA second domain-containing protein [Listeria aquatica]